MARAIGCGLSTGLLVAEKSNLHVLLKTTTITTPTTTTTTVFFPVNKKSGRNFGRVAACASASSSTTRKPRGIMVPQRISPALQDLVGVPEISRTQALKLIWAHIKTHNLQDPNNKKIIVCDEKLKNVFGGKERVGFLEISGLITPHFLKAQN